MKESPLWILWVVFLYLFLIGYFAFHASPFIREKFTFHCEACNAEFYYFPFVDRVKCKECGAVFFL